MEKNNDAIFLEFGKMVMLERRKARRWSIFFRILWSALFFLVAATFVFRTGAPVGNIELSNGASSAHTALIKLQGPIISEAPASAEHINKALNSAFENENSKAIIIEIDTPGGSPVQSSMIYNEIQRLRELHPDKKIYTVVNDICASGGMYVAVATDAIYADPASLIGSIGVIAPNIGFVELIAALGIRDRTLTAGIHKDLLSPFKEENAVEVANIQQALDQVHEQFIDKVKSGRGERIADNSDIFTGLIWTGEGAKELGLIDDFGSARFVAREIVGEENIVEYKAYDSFLQEFAENLGAAAFNTFYTLFNTPRLQ